jgi:hypothetical protein
MARFRSTFASRHGRFLAGWALLTLALAGCDSGNPVVAAGPTSPQPAEPLAVTVVVSPSQLRVGGSDPATVRISVRQTVDNLPPADGTSALVSVDQGSLGVASPDSPVLQQSLPLTGGEAQTSYFPGATIGTATVLAQVGSTIGQGAVELVENLPSDFYLLGVDPSIGRPEGGDSVRVDGVGLRQPLRVLFGGVQAPVTSVATDGSSVQVTSPALATPLAAGGFQPVDVAVTNALNDPVPVTDMLAGGFIYSEDPAPPPLFVVEVIPSVVSALGGTTVRVRGGGFEGRVRVDFGGKAGIDPVVVSSAEIRVVTPESPQPVAAGSRLPVDVTVVGSLDTEPQTDTLRGGLTFDGGAAPFPVVVESIFPIEGPAAGGTEVTVTGSGFQNPVAIELGGLRQLDEGFITSNQARFTTRPLTNAATCPADGRVTVQGLTVTNLSSGITGSAQLAFTYLVSIPRLTRVSPAAGTQLGNTVLSVEGSGFEQPVRVLFSTPEAEFTGTVQSVTESLVRVATPRLPDSAFAEVDCVTGDGEPGKRYTPLTVGVRLINLDGGCEDSLPNVYTYNPANASCRIVTPPAGGG